MSEKQSQATPEISDEAYSEFVRALFNWSGDNAKDFTHAMLGVVTEIHELRHAIDEVNGVEEIGDMTFYFEALTQVAERAIGEPILLARVGILNKIGDLYKECAIKGPVAVLQDVCNGLLDISKRWVGYGKAPENFNELLLWVAAIGYTANVTSPYPCTDLQRVRAANMAKLMKRYKGGKFSQIDALNRDLEAERAVLASA